MQTAEIEIVALEQVGQPEGQVARSVGRNTMIMLVSQLITFSLTFIWTVALQSKLGLAGNGTLFYAQNLAWIGAIFIDGGVSTYLSKQVARDHAETRALLSNALWLRMLSAILVYNVIMVVALFTAESRQELSAVAIVTAGIVLAGFTQAFASTFQGRQNMLPTALGIITEKVVTTALSVILLQLGYGLLPVTLVMVLGAFCNLIIVGQRALRNGWISFSFDATLMRRIVAGGAPFFLWAAFGVIYQRNAAIQLAALTDNETTAWFGAAVRLYETLSFVPNIFMAAVLPVLARGFVQSDTSDSHATSRRSLDLIVLAAMPIATLVVVLAPWIIEIVTSGRAEYFGAVLPLQILGISIIPLYVDIILATILISADKQRQWSLVAIGAALINPLFNWLLIQWTADIFGNGAVGSATVTLLTEAVILVFYVWLVPEGILSWDNLAYAGRAIIAALLLGITAWLVVTAIEEVLPNAGYGKLGAFLMILPAGLAGGVVFLIAAVLLRVIGPDEVGLIRRALRRG